MWQFAERFTLNCFLLSHRMLIPRPFKACNGFRSHYFLIVVKHNTYGTIDSLALCVQLLQLGVLDCWHSPFDVVLIVTFETIGLRKHYKLSMLLIFGKVLSLLSLELIY